MMRTGWSGCRFRGGSDGAIGVATRWSTLALLVAIAAGSARAQDGEQDHAGPQQGWSDDLRQAFYYTPQGSHLVPYAWALALEVPEGTERFFAPENMERFGYLPGATGNLNPDRLPIGFTRDPAPDSDVGDWLGMNCAACHTGEMVYGDATIRVDGAPTLADFQAFMRDLVAAFDSVLGDPAKFERFVAALGGAAPDAKVTLRDRVEAYAADLRQLVASNWTAEPYGFGRLDAFGHILNAVAGGALAEPGNYRTPDAPVSYPFLWTTPQQRYIQWNGVAGNPIGRNTGQVLGVFGQMDLLASGADRFRTTVLAENLLEMEQWVAMLEPPRWDDDLLGAPDPDRLERGSALYADHCQACHRDQAYEYAERENLASRRALKVTMVEGSKVGTDPTMLTNFYRRWVTPGPLSELVGDADLVPAGRLLAKVVENVVEQDFTDRRVPPEERLVYKGGRFDEDLTGWERPASYKAGPLAGIWATAPFLHNGSVPTLYDLLSPEAERPATFLVGSTRFDPVKVGFLSAADDFTAEERASLFHFDTSRPGNANLGHNYPKEPLADEDKFALIDYIKTLEGPPLSAPEHGNRFEAIPPNETEGIDELAAIVVELQDRRAANVPEQEGQLLRGVHPKSHGCVRAEFTVDEDIDPAHQVGVFAEPGRTFEAWIRYSNAAVLREDDLKAADPAQPNLRSNGSRGMAIKLLDVEGEVLDEDDGRSNQDFLMINTPQFAFSTVRDYLRLNRILMLSDKGESAAEFFLPLQLAQQHQPPPGPGHPRYGDIFASFNERDLQNTGKSFAVIKQKIETRTVRNPLEVQYFGAAPFGFGPDRAMKFSAAPCKPRTQEPFETVVAGDPSPDYLREALTETMQGEEDVCFDFMIQLRGPGDLAETQLEDATTTWPDELESYQRVARINIPVPQEPESAEVVEQCEAMAFTPWHSLTVHQPLGGINRLRRQVYLGSALHRGADGYR